MSIFEAKKLLSMSYEKVGLPDIKLTHYPRDTETVSPIATVTLDRPQNHNAFTPEMANSLEQASKCSISMIV